METSRLDHFTFFVLGVEMEKLKKVVRETLDGEGRRMRIDNLNFCLPTGKLILPQLMHIELADHEEAHRTISLTEIVDGVSTTTTYRIEPLSNIEAPGVTLVGMILMNASNPRNIVCYVGPGKGVTLGLILTSLEGAKTANRHFVFTDVYRGVESSLKVEVSLEPEQPTPPGLRLVE